MAAMTEITCKCGCGRKKMVRNSDIKRGWGKFYSKSCKAKKQERTTGQYRRYKQQDSNFRGSGVSKETWMHYHNEYGGIPQFDRNGNYEGFCDGYFDNTSCQNEGPND